MPDACPFGLFDVSKCSCSAESSLDLGCKPHFLTSFDDRGALSAVRTTTVNVILASSVGLFPGNARVSVPLSFVDILARKADRPLRVNLRYKELSPINDGDHQLLVQSAPCVFGGLLAVYVNKAAVYLRIFTQQGEISSTEVFTEGFDISSWKSLRIRYSSSDGLRVTVSSKTLTYTSFIEVPPDLSVSECGWTFGYPERLDHLSPFTGGMDDIEVAYC